MNRRGFLFGLSAGTAMAFGTTSAAHAQIGPMFQQLASSGALPPFIDGALFGNAPFPMTLARGTTSLVRSLAELYLAIDDRASAEQLSLLSGALQGEYGADDISAVQVVVESKSSIDLAAVNATSNATAAEHIQKSTLYSGLGIAYNAIAIDQGRELAQNTGRSLRGLGSGGLGGALGAARQLTSDRRPIVLAQAATQTIPSNLQLAQRIYQSSREYMQLNDLAMPTQDDAAMALSEWE